MKAPVLVTLVLALAVSTAAAQQTGPVNQGPAAPKPGPVVSGPVSPKPGPAQTAPAKADQAKTGPTKAGQKPRQPVTPPTVAPAAVPAVPPPPPGYVVGPDDVLVLLFWANKEMSAEVVVRPDGMISLPLLNDVSVAGLTPDQLRDRVTEAAKQYVVDPSVTVVVKQINSRKVFVTGQVGKPGPYPLSGPTTVLQALALAGGLSEFAKQKDISIVRSEGGKTTRFKFNYKDVVNGKNLRQNIELRPGDTVIVP